MTHAPVILLGLIGQLLLPCEGIALRAEPASDCLDAVPGDSCHKFVTWALEKGIEKHPDWFPLFERSDSDEQNFKQVQEIYHTHGKAGCGKPCFTAPAAQEAAPAAPTAEEAKPEAALAALSEEAKPVEAPAPAAQEQRPRSKLIGNLEAEIKTLVGMNESPTLETLRTEKRQLIHNLQTADKLEAEFKARQLQNLQTLNKLEAERKALEAMDSTPASEILRSEKAMQVQKAQAADKAYEEQTTRELQRLQDPAASANEVAPVARAEEVKPATQEAEERPPRSDLIHKLEAELNAMDQIHISPALETLREEKRQFINNLQTADKMEAELKARLLRNLQAENKLEADLKALEVMDDTQALEGLREEKLTLLHNLQASNKSDTEQVTQELQRLSDPATAAAAPAEPTAIVDPETAAAGHKPWWQRRWRGGKAKEEALALAREEAVDDKAQATPAEAPAVAAEEAKPEAVREDER